MALREILNESEGVLHKVCRPVTDFDERLWTLLDDMAETLEEGGGVGLGGPQVGVLRRLFVMDVGDGLVEAVNPQIIGRKGRQEGSEGCLSCPGKWGIVVRPQKVILKAQNRHGEWFTMKGEDLAARCICHEYDHLDGILFTERAERMLGPDEVK